MNEGDEMNVIVGDELSRTQQGNNNAYCQDNEISWLNWEGADKVLLKFTQKVIQLRREHPVFRRRTWFRGRPVKGDELEDIAWFKFDGGHMTDRRHVSIQRYALSTLFEK